MPPYPSIRAVSRRITKMKAEGDDWYDKAGAYFAFIRLNEEWGFKWSYGEGRETPLNKKVIYAIHNTQARAAEVGAAPEVGPVHKTKHGWGFYTRAIKATYKELHPFSYYGLYSIETDEARKLADLLAQAGLYMQDMHGNNFGYMPDGRLVAIDFSDIKIEGRFVHDTYSMY